MRKILVNPPYLRTTENINTNTRPRHRFIEFNYHTSIDIWVSLNGGLHLIKCVVHVHSGIARTNSAKWPLPGAAFSTIRKVLCLWQEFDMSQIWSEPGLMMLCSRELSACLSAWILSQSWCWQPKARARTTFFIFRRKKTKPAVSVLIMQYTSWFQFLLVVFCSPCCSSF